jgi:hypothetical protein
MPRRLLLLLVSLGFIIAALPAAGQSARPDTTLPASTKDTIQPIQKSPTTAILYSLAFPGLGQVYVESWWKAPIMAGAAGFFMYQIISYHTQYTDKANAYDAAIQSGKSPNDPTVDLLRRQREFYNNNRDLSALYLLAVYGIAAVDAYVGAHLFSFDVSDKLSLRLQPDPLRGGAVLMAGIQF